VKVGLNDPRRTMVLRSSDPIGRPGLGSCPLTAAREGRSLAQICEAFLKARSETYKKEGLKYLQRFLSRQKSEDISN